MAAVTESKTEIAQQQIDAFINSITDNESKKKPLGPLVQVFRDIAKTANSKFTWKSLRRLIRHQLQLVIDDYSATSPKVPDVDGESFEVRQVRVLGIIDEWPREPFTLQRICELLVDAKRMYPTTAKFFLAFSKLVCGITARPFDDEKTLDKPLSRNELSEKTGEAWLESPKRGNSNSSLELSAVSSLSGAVATVAPWATEKQPSKSQQTTMTDDNGSVDSTEPMADPPASKQDKDADVIMGGQ